MLKGLWRCIVATSLREQVCELIPRLPALLLLALAPLSLASRRRLVLRK